MTVSRATSPVSLRARFASRVDWPSWFASASFIGTVLAAAAVLWPSTQSLLHDWIFVETSSYGHGPLIVLVSVGLAIRAIRAESAPVVPERNPLRWWVLLAVSSFVWLVALRSGIQLAHQMLLPVMVWLTVRILLGSRIATLTLIPIALFYSAIPLWHISVPALQAVTVSVVGTLLRVAGVPTFVEGEFIYIPNGVFHVEQGCAGLRFFIVGVTLAAVLGEIRSDRWRTRIGLVAIAAVLSLAANWVRVFVVVYAGHLTDMQHYLVRVEHVRFGWLVFAVMMAVFLVIARRWNSQPNAAHGASIPTPVSQRAFLAALTLALAALLVGPAWSWVAPVRAAAAVNVTSPESIGEWSTPRKGCQISWQPQFRGADRESMREYAHGSGSVCVFVATYLSQHQDKELIGYYSRVFDATSEVVANRVRVVDEKSLNEVQLASRAGPERLVWYTYVVGDRTMRHGIEAQLRYAFGSLHDAPASSVLALSALCVPDCIAARGLLTDFLPHVRVGQAEK